MKSVSQWVEGMKSMVHNGRSHSVVIDLPDEQGGSDFGATALELALMALAGCVSTIFALIARNSSFEFEDLRVEADAEKGPRTIEKADIKVYLKAEDDKKALRILEKTLAVCPVGIIFENAGVAINTELVMMQ